jgi:hypothetical protein
MAAAAAATAITIVDKTAGRERKHRGSWVGVIRTTLAHGGKRGEGSGGRRALALGRVAVTKIFSSHTVPVLILIHCMVRI